jgi:hypothetical protein
MPSLGYLMHLDDLATAASYTPRGLEQVRIACLTVAAVLGDLMEEEITVVGGLVPSLIVDQRQLPEGAEPHPGTMDLDLALQLAVLEEGGYRNISERLRSAGFEPDRNAAGNLTRQRWVMHGVSKPEVTVDFLIPPVEGRKGRILQLESDFGAVISPGLELAFSDRMLERLDGVTIRGDHVIRDIWVCGPGALVVLKALACRGRDKPKDAFDLYYVLRNFGNGPADVARRLRPWKDHPTARRAVDILASDFADVTRTGPRRVARFLGMDEDADVQAQVVAFVAEFLESLESLEEDSLR